MRTNFSGRTRWHCLNRDVHYERVTASSAKQWHFTIVDVIQAVTFRQRPNATVNDGERFLRLLAQVPVSGHR